MSLTFAPGRTGSASTVPERIHAGMTAVSARLWRFFAIYQTRRALQELPDFILRDIGISRGEIPSVAEEAHQHRQHGGDRWRRART